MTTNPALPLKDWREKRMAKLTEYQRGYSKALKDVKTIARCQHWDAEAKEAVGKLLAQIKNCLEGRPPVFGGKDASER